jgi:nucleoside 2-deoxyribosyltransferase
MQLFLSIKYHADQRNRAQTEAILSVLEQAGHQTCCVVRDVEQWGKFAFTPAELMARTFAAIEASDAVIVEETEKGVGLGVEAGYAYARGIPVIVVAPPGADVSETLQGIALSVQRYAAPADLRGMKLPTPGRRE